MGLAILDGLATVDCCPHTPPLALLVRVTVAYAAKVGANMCAGAGICQALVYAHVGAPRGTPRGTRARTCVSKKTSAAARCAAASAPELGSAPARSRLTTLPAVVQKHCTW